MNRVERNRETNVWLLRLIDNVGCIDAVIREVVVVTTSAGKANASLIASACVNRSRRKRCKRSPVTAIQWKLIHLILLDLRSQRIRSLIKRLGCRRDIDLLGSFGQCKSDIQGSGSAHFLNDIVEVK